jgi:hypothetical protein
MKVCRWRRDALSRKEGKGKGYLVSCLFDSSYRRRRDDDTVDRKERKERKGKERKGKERLLSAALYRYIQRGP